MITRTSIPGTWNRAVKGPASRRNGFSLLEIMVVLALISLTLVFAVPRFGASVAGDPALGASRWILLTVARLKREAALDQQLRTLHLDIGTGRMWITRGEKPPPEATWTVEGGLDLDHRVRLMDVEYPSRDKVIQDVARIRFHPQGYSDRAIIHLETDDQRRFSFQIEPFLAQAKLFEKYTEFEP